VSLGLRLTGDEKAALTKSGQRDATADSTSKRQTLKKRKRQKLATTQAALFHSQKAS